MKALWGLIWFVLFWLAIMIMIAIANPGKSHHGKPTPVPTPTPSPSPPSPSPTPPSLTLAWDSPGDPSIIGYALWVGFSSGAENQENDLGLVLTTTLQLSGGTTYFFYVTSYDAQHNMSVPSNEVTYQTP